MHIIFKFYPLNRSLMVEKPASLQTTSAPKSREMKNHQNQIRVEPVNRRFKDSSLKLPSDESKPQKITKKSLNTAFSLVSKEAPVDLTNCSIDSTSTVEISEDLEIDSAENIVIGNMNSPSLSALSKASMTADLTPSSAITTNSNELFDLDGDEISELWRLENLPEVEMVVKYLKQAKLQMLNSTGMDLRFKKLLDVLIEVTVKEFCSLPDERDYMDKFFSAKSCILFSCILACLIASSMILLLRWGIEGSAYYPPPT